MPKPERADMIDIIGNFDGMKRALILDDMINTDGTVEVAIKKVCHNTEVNEI